MLTHHVQHSKHRWRTYSKAQGHLRLSCIGKAESISIQEVILLTSGDKTTKDLPEFQCENVNFVAHCTKKEHIYNIKKMHLLKKIDKNNKDGRINVVWCLKPSVRSA